MNPSNETYQELKKRIDLALQKDNINKSRVKALNAIRIKHRALADQISGAQLKTKFRTIKSNAIQNLPQLIKLATTRLQENGCKVYYARTTKDIFRILDTLINESIIVKCKTNASKEIKLKDYLVSRNIELIETDLGDRLVQLTQTHPSHPLIPSLHITQQQAAQLFSLDEHAPLEAIIAAARANLRDLVLKANISISGANAIAAEEGFICLEENEGNQRLITSLPRKHIVLAGIEKIVPTAEDALTIMKSAAYFGLAVRSGVYLSFISGPSRTADIEYQLTYGMHGPKEVHVILFDNGRQRLIDKGFSELLYCVNCGGCVNYCPIYEEIGDAFGSDTFVGGQGLLFLSHTKEVKSSFQNGLNFCTGCQACTVACPGSINTYQLMLKTRSEAIQQDLLLPVHQKIFESISQYSNPFAESPSARCKWLSQNINYTETDTLLFLGCMASYRVQSQAKTGIALLNYLHIPFTYLGIEEPCCGSVLHNLGMDEPFTTIQTRVQDKLAKFSDIITICPGCYSTFKTAYSDFLHDNHIKLQHLTEILPAYSKRFQRPNIKVTYHDPCHLGRHFELYEPPRTLFKELNLSFQEMEYTKEKARCCGAGGGVLAAFPNLAKKIAGTRIQDALRTQAEILLTSCPFCEYNLAQAAQGVQVCSLQEFLMTHST